MRYAWCWTIKYLGSYCEVLFFYFEQFSCERISSLIRHVNKNPSYNFLPFRSKTITMGCYLWNTAHHVLQAFFFSKPRFKFRVYKKQTYHIGNRKFLEFEIFRFVVKLWKLESKLKNAGERITEFFKFF